MKIQAIQYLRAIAAIAVVLDHAAAMSAFDKYYGQETRFFDFFLSGTLGVSLFFCISGFIIVVSTFRAESFEARKTFTQFLIARFIRIVPVMWIAILSYAFLRFLGRGEFYLEEYLNAFFLLPFGDYDPNNIWTLRHELIFYVVFCVAFLTIKPARLLLGVWLIVPFVAAIFFPEPAQGASLSKGADAFYNVFSPVNILFGLGVLLGYVYLRFPGWFSRFEGAHPVILYLQKWWVLGLIFAATLAANAYLLVDTNVVVKNIIIVLVFMAIIFVSLFDNGDVNKLFFYLGNASFSIYLFHPHFESMLLTVMSKILPGLPVLLVVGIISILATAMGCLIYSFVEVPLTRKLTALTRREVLVSQSQQA